MTTERLIGLSLIHFHRDVSVDITDVIGEFARRHRRRMHLLT